MRTIRQTGTVGTRWALGGRRCRYAWQLAVALGVPIGAGCTVTNTSSTPDGGGSGGSSGGTSGTSSSGSASTGDAGSDARTSSGGSSGGSSGASGGSSSGSSGASSSGASDGGGDAGSEAHSEGAAPDAPGDAPAESSTDGGCTTGGGLIVNGSFECPTVPVGGFLSYSRGQSFDGWTVVGASGSVSPLSGSYRSGSITWTAEDGKQTLDLTGDGSNTATGVQQTVSTSVGQTYTLTFWVGNIDDPSAGWGTSSTVKIQINGSQVLSAVNSGGDAGATTLSWQKFQVQFTATTQSTDIAFINGDPSTDNSNILDNVTLN
jgi:hypothetical protein